MDINQEVEELIKFTEEESATEKRFRELEAKADKTDEEKRELDEVKKKRSDGFKAKIGKALERARVAEDKTKSLETKLAEVEKKIISKSPSATDPLLGFEETVTIAGQAWSTDEALQQMVDDGKITSQQALKYAKQRDALEIEEKVTNRIQSKAIQDENNLRRIKDRDAVLAKHPEFHPEHEKHNPSDPLFKLTKQLFEDGYGSQVDGFSKALSMAEKILARNNTILDLTDDVTLHPGGVSMRNEPIIDNNTLSDDERRLAIQQYTRGDVINPKTGRPYTKDEAVTKYLEARNMRKKQLAERR